MHFPTCLGIDWGFPLHFPRSSDFLSIKIKKWRQQKNLKTISGSDLSIYTTYGQTQIRVTVPLITKFWCIIYQQQSTIPFSIFNFLQLICTVPYWLLLTMWVSCQDESWFIRANRSMLKELASTKNPHFMWKLSKVCKLSKWNI